MRALFSSRYARALAKTILFFVSIHLIVAVFLASRNNLYALNAFHIVSLDLVIPGVGEGMVNFVVSWCVVLVVYCFAYVYLTRPTNKDKS
jgi:hypothetical protein